MTLPKLYLDFETKSEIDPEVHGLDLYVRHPSTQVLMLAYALDDAEVSLWEPHLEPIPPKLVEDLNDITITKVAWHVSFEQNIFKHVLQINLPFWLWNDPVNQARMLSMPGKLADVCKILQLPEEFSKDPEGKKLIKLFSLPARHGGFNDWSTHPQEWERFKDYCRRDVIAEREIAKRLEKFPLPDNEYQGWLLDQQINERGLPVDMELVRGTHAVAEAEKERLRAELKALTALENPNSVQQLLAWMQPRGYPFGSLAKPLVKRALDGEGRLTPEGRRALVLRGQTAKTSDSKLEAIADAVGSDGRLRHQYVFLGAAKTGRWASFHVQLANLPRPTKEVEKNLDLAIQLLRAEDRVGLALEFPNTLEVVSSCIRSMFKAGRGKELVVADLNAIENRMIGWLAECDAILRVFQEGRDPYLDFAALLHNRPYAELEAAYKAGDPKAKELRTQAKPAVLGCGYRLSGGEEVINDDGDKIKTGLWGYAASMGVALTQEDAKAAVKIFRARYKEVINCWYALEDAAKHAMFTGEPQRCGHVEFQTFGDKLLRLLLPSGRGIHYIRPRIELLPFMDSEKETLTYEGIDTKTKQWVRLRTHGGRLLENISQATSRDILLTGMLNAAKAGFHLIGHVHDELISEEEVGSRWNLQQLIDCMIAPPPWAPDLPLGADGFTSEVYRK